jgi:hypothetical protein
MDWIGLPQDSQGYVRRECPHCRRQFKTRTGPSDGAIVQRYLGRHLRFQNPHEIVRDDAVFHCVYCGAKARADEWCTPHQRIWLEKVANALGQEIRFEQLAFAHRTLRDNPSPTFVALPPRGRLPQMRAESDDMLRASFFCCVEDAKVDVQWLKPLFCPGCGSEHQTAPARTPKLTNDPVET